MLLRLAGMVGVWAVVGAYFGVRVGAHGKTEAEAARVASEAKVARLALHVDKQDAARVLHELDR